MIRNVKYIFLILFLIMALTGCATTDLTMEIDSNGIVKLTHIVLVDENDFEDFKEIIKADSEALKNNGYNVEEITEGSKMGYKIYKTIGGLGGVDNNHNESVELTEYAKTGFDNSLLFKHKKGLLSNKYTASYNIDLTDMDKAIMYIPIFNGSAYTPSYSDDDYVAKSRTDSEDFKILNNEVLTTFTLDSAFKVGNNNATSVENGKYVWKLGYGKINEIYFEFNRINTGSIIVICSVLAIIGFSFLFVNYRKQKLRAYARVSLRESLDLEHNITTRSEIRDIRMKRKYFPKDEKKELEAISINERISGGNTSLGAYSNLTTIEKLNERLSVDTAKKEIIPINEQKDPKFRAVGDQVKKNIEKNMDGSKKFIDEEKK